MGSKPQRCPALRWLKTRVSVTRVLFTPRRSHPVVSWSRNAVDFGHGSPRGLGLTTRRQISVVVHFGGQSRRSENQIEPLSVPEPLASSIRALSARPTGGRCARPAQGLSGIWPEQVELPRGALVHSLPAWSRSGNSRFSRVNDVDFAPIRHLERFPHSLFDKGGVTRIDFHANSPPAHSAGYPDRRPATEKRIQYHATLRRVALQHECH